MVRATVKSHLCQNLKLLKSSKGASLLFFFNLWLSTAVILGPAEKLPGLPLGLILNIGQEAGSHFRHRQAQLLHVLQDRQSLGSEQKPQEKIQEWEIDLQGPENRLCCQSHDDDYREMGKSLDDPAPDKPGSKAPPLESQA